MSLRCTERENVKPKSETDSNQSQFSQSRVLRSQCLRRKTVGTRRTRQGISQQRFSSSRDGFRFGKTHSTAQGPGGLKHIEIRCMAIQQWIREELLSGSRVDTKNNPADLFTKQTDGLRTQSLAKKLGLVRMVRMVRTGVTTESFFFKALPVEQACKYSQF